ncbi:RHS repeat-associated core domain-containing protein [Persicobacter psychrovividus]|uniref:RHS repeat-associated core domain-containing protein n=1 Tax=Persicobacter psychrovividus TaxID=387638 RepID=A0ABM7VHF8_9BACT|nr:hypothetical protein PEPS_24350 [Persicobacter psychrovividus]
MSADYAMASGATFKSTTDQFKVNNLSYDKNKNIQKISRFDDKGDVMDDFTYHYSSRNQLARVAHGGLGDYGSFSYDEIGQLKQAIYKEWDGNVELTEQKLTLNPTFNLSGHMTRVDVQKGTNLFAVNYGYNVNGHRSFQANDDDNLKTYYVNDASGNVLAIYQQSNQGTPQLIEVPIYGSSRLGTAYAGNEDPVYEIRDHLGNVRSLVAWNKEAINSGGHASYYPFGYRMSTTDISYRYGYQGEFAEDDTNTHNWHTFQARMYDARIGRWISVDPARQFASGYVGMGNNPVMMVDPGGEAIITSMLIGVAISVATNGISNSFNGNNFWDGAGKAAIFGAIGGAASFGIGQMIVGIPATGAGSMSAFGKGTLQAFMHGHVGGVMNLAQGGEYIHGFASGAMGSAASSAIGGIKVNPKNIYWQKAGLIAAGGLVGGVSSEIAGGEFADGFRNGLISSGLNHAAHPLASKLDEKIEQGKENRNYNKLNGPDKIRYKLGTLGNYDAGEINQRLSEGGIIFGGIESLMQSTTFTSVKPIYGHVSPDKIVGVMRSTPKIIPIIGGIAKHGGLAVGVFSVAYDAVQLYNGNQTLGNFIYNTTGVGAAYAAGMVHPLLGVAVGAGFYLAPMAIEGYQNLMQEITYKTQRGYIDFNNGIRSGWVPRF